MTRNVASVLFCPVTFNLAETTRMIEVARALDPAHRPVFMGYEDDFVHLISEAERLAYADRAMYVADTDFVPLPGGSWHAMLDSGYLASVAGDSAAAAKNTTVQMAAMANTGQLAR